VRKLNRRCRFGFVLGAATLVAILWPTAVAAAGPPVVVFRDAGLDANTSRRILATLGERRSVLPIRALPVPTAESPEVLANQQRIDAIGRALERAQAHAARAEWTGCAKEAGDRLADATTLLADTGEFELLYKLYTQIGTCLSLPDPASAKPYFLNATLLDESPPLHGMVREEAERLWQEQRLEVLSRHKGLVRIKSTPPGAQVWIDGRAIEGVTPVDVPVRLGRHFVTLRRFRHEPQSEVATFQPGSEMEFVMAAARRTTLREQLRGIREGARAISRHELRLARATWSTASELVTLSKPPGPSTSVRVTLFDASTGKAIRTRLVAASSNDSALRATACAVLGEQCEEPGLSLGQKIAIGALASAAVASVAIAIGFAVTDAQDTQLCPPSGCN